MALDPAHAGHPAARCLHRQDPPIYAFASTVVTVQELVRAGAGIWVRPCLIGDLDPRWHLRARSLRN
ncbi:hypothetical protein [uncultured Paracoccus sp.]|uniref:hypothetical protein n=1 Tax=uncultured Paracoccus sp. TaxID=189685 RepID=UPI0026174FCA|nr:hypothetical protein [uncultured Paracoccus sp.]